jgi:ribosomal protein L37AE/L43A
VSDYTPVTDQHVIEVDGVAHEVVAEVHRCGFCLSEQWGDYREMGTFWQCRACGCVFEVGVTW